MEETRGDQDYPDVANSLAFALKKVKGLPLNPAVSHGHLMIIAAQTQDMQRSSCSGSKWTKVSNFQDQFCTEIAKFSSTVNPYQLMSSHSYNSVDGIPNPIGLRVTR